MSEMYTLDETPYRETDYHARFYFIPNAVDIPAGGQVDLFEGRDASSAVAFSVSLRELYGEYNIRVTAGNDAQQNTSSQWISVSDVAHAIELVWTTASAGGTGNGSLALWIDGQEKANLTGLENGLRRIEAVRLGLLSLTTEYASGSIHFDDFVSNRTGYIGLNGNIPTPDPLPEQIFSDAYESGDLSAWTASATDYGDLSASTASALEGNYGLEAVIDDDEDLYVLDGRPFGDQLYQARFYFDPNSVKIPAEATLDIFRGLTSDTNTAFTLQLGMLNDDYAIRAVMLDDEQQSTASDWIPINNAPHCLELQWWRAKFAEVSDGRMQLWIDENGGMVLQDVDNDTLSIDAVDLGVLSPSTTTIAGKVYFDDFSSNRAGSYIGLDPNVTLPSSDAIFADGFESTDLSGWNSAETDSGDLSVTAGAALFDSYGLAALVDDGNPLFVQDNSPIQEPHYRVRFYFDPNSIYIPDDYGLTLFEGRDRPAGTVLRIDLRYSDDEYQVEATIIDDSQSSTDTGWTTVTDEPHALEVEWLAAWDSENADGGLIFWVDEEKSGYIPWIDNDTHRVDTVRLGAPAMTSTSLSGTLFLDDFVSHKSEYIGLNEEERSAMQERGRGLCRPRLRAVRP